MELITLLTDYSHKDFYLAKVKSRVNKFFPNYTILDICHGVSKFNVKEASYAFNAILPEFDSNKNIHFIFINNHYQKKYDFILAETKNNGLIVAPNNGILGLLKCDIDNFYHLDIHKSSFVELEIIEKLQNLDLNTLKKIDLPILLKEIPVKVTEKQLRGEVIYIDNYGNCITNITKDIFSDFVKGKSYHIALRRNNIIESISIDYSDNWEGGPAAFFNEQGYLEISSIHGHASELFGLKYESRIIVNKN